MEPFAQRKAQTLAELALDAGDFSRAGHVDERARPIVALVNSHPSFFTTSSCAGRVSLFADPTSATRAAGMKGGEWVYVNHDPADADAVVAAVRRKLGDARDEDAAEDAAPPVSDPECTLVLRFEPFILSVEASSIDEGGRIVACARDAGYRESGVTASDKRTVCSIRCSIRMEVPVVSRGVRLVTDDALRALVGIANEKWTANAARAERLVERFTAVFGSETTTTPIPAASIPNPEEISVADVPRTPAPGAGPAANATPKKTSPVANRAAAEAEDWVYLVDKPSAKACKDALKSAGWLDKTRRAGVGDGGRVALPITSRGSEALLAAVASDADANAIPVSAAAALAALREGAADLERSAADDDPSDSAALDPSDSAALDPKSRRAPRLPPKSPKRVPPAAAIRAAALETVPDAASAKAGEIPTKWEKLGDLALLPAGAFASSRLWTADALARVYPAVASALGVTRLARQAEVSRGPKRESRAEMLWDPENRGGWVETRELGVTYGLDVTRVMFSSGNGTEKARMAGMAAAGETVVDLFAGIGYYTLQLLHHAGVAKVYACEWNPNSVAALRRNLALNAVDPRRCEVLVGDNRRTAPSAVADRVLLGLLPDSERAWPIAVEALRVSGGVMHVHGNVASGEEEAWTRRLESTVAEIAASFGREWSVRVEHVERVKWYAPRVRHLVADVRCVPARLASAWAHAVGASTSPLTTAATSTASTTPGASTRETRESEDGDAVATPANLTQRGPEAPAKMLPGYVRASVKRLEQTPSADGEEEFVRRPRKTSGDAPGDDAEAAGAAVDAGGPSPRAPAGRVRTMHRPTAEAFRAGPAATREPCVLTGLDVGPAPWTWSPSHLAAKPGVAETEVSVHVSESPHLDFVRKNFSFENVRFGELLGRLAAEAEGSAGTANEGESRRWYYLRSIGRNPRKEPAHALAQFPELAEELRVPGDVLWGGDAAADAGERYFSAVLRCSSGGARLWTHYDAMDNALVQLHGEKRVLLFPPRVAAGLYLDGSSSPIVGPGVDGEGGWPEAFPAYQAAREAALEVILQPGDVLYVPALWAHHVEALHGPSVAVNVFFRELDKASYPAKDLYGNADPVAAAQALEACAGAAKRLASLPRDHRVFYGGVAAARLLRDLRVEREVAPTIAAGGDPGEDSAGGPGARTGAGAGANGAVAVRAPGEGWSGTISWGNLAVGVALGGAVVGAAAAWRGRQR